MAFMNLANFWPSIHALLPPLPQEKSDLTCVPMLIISFPGSEAWESGTKKEHKPKLLSPDIFRWGRGLRREGVGARKFGKSLETREIKLFGAGYPGILPGYPGGARKV